MIGFPTETLDEVMQTARFIEKNDFNDLLIFIVSPYNRSELENMIDPEKLERIVSDKTRYDYQWGDYSISDIPGATLEKIQAKYHKKGKLKLSNLGFLLQNAKGMLLNLFTYGNRYMLGSLFFHTISVFGMKKRSLRRRALQMRYDAFNRLNSSLEEVPKQETIAGSPVSGRFGSSG